VQLRVLITDLHTAPAVLAQRVQTIECVIEVLHTNLAAARRWVATLTQEKG